jgi:hypothetical protein
MNDTLIDRVKRIYWKVIPYEVRPGQLWYRFKCFVWHRYSTVKPRYLPHTWCDRTSVMPHMMFEILCQFVEKECSPGHVEWYGDDPHTVMVDGEEKNVMDEMKDLIEWWTVVYNKERGEVEEMLWAEAEKHSPKTRFEPYAENLLTMEFDYKSDESKAIYHRCMDGIHKLEMNEELERRLHRIIPLIPYMWT